MKKITLTFALIGLLVFACGNDDFSITRKAGSALGDLSNNYDTLYSFDMPCTIGDYWKYESVPLDTNYSFDMTVSDVKYGFGNLCYIFERDAPKDTSTSDKKAIWEEYWKTKNAPIISILEDVFVGPHVARWRYVNNNLDRYTMPGVTAYFEYPFWDDPGWRNVLFPRDGYVELEFPVYEGKEWDAWILQAGDRHEFGTINNPDSRFVDLASVRTCLEYLPSYQLSSTNEILDDCFHIREQLVRRNPKDGTILAPYSNAGDFWYCSNVGLVRIDVYLQNQDPPDNVPRGQTTNIWELVNYKIDNSHFIKDVN